MQALAALQGPVLNSSLSPPPAQQIMNLALLVVSYGVSHRLFEFAWKGQLRALYPTPAAYQVGLGWGFMEGCGGRWAG